MPIKQPISTPASAPKPLINQPTLPLTPKPIIPTPAPKLDAKGNPIVTPAVTPKVSYPIPANLVSFSILAVDGQFVLMVNHADTKKIWYSEASPLEGVLKTLALKATYFANLTNLNLKPVIVPTYTPEDDRSLNRLRNMAEKAGEVFVDVPYRDAKTSTLNTNVALNPSATLPYNTPLTAKDGLNQSVANQQGPLPTTPPYTSNVPANPTPGVASTVVNPRI